MTENNQLICNHELFEHINKNVQSLEVISHNATGPKQAAVAITVVEALHASGLYGMPSRKRQDNTAALILTRRTSKLKNHSGQWAFPGGRIDQGETAEDTALRELAEEVGLKLDKSRIIGRLDDFTTRSGFTITPVVVWGGPNIEDLEANRDEVRAIHRIPISEFLRKDAPILEETAQSEHPVLMMPVGSSWIAAPTGAMIYQFREVAILGRHTRVAHFDQPTFAWK